MGSSYAEDAGRIYEVQVSSGRLAQLILPAQKLLQNLSRWLAAIVVHAILRHHFQHFRVAVQEHISDPAMGLTH